MHGDNGKVPDAVIGKKMGVTNGRVGDYRTCSHLKERKLQNFVKKF